MSTRILTGVWLGLAVATPGFAQTASIPLCPGVTVVTAVSQRDGDYESIKTVVGRGDEGVRVRYSTERTVDDMLDGKKFVRLTTHRTVAPADAASATSYLQIFSEDIPERVPGTTAIGTSAAVLDALKAGREVELGLYIAGFVGPQSLDRENHPNLYDYEAKATLRRVGGSAVPVTVLLDGRPTALPAIQAAGEFAGEKVEFFFLDDPANPLALKFRMGIGAVSKEDAELDRLAGGSLVAGGDRDVLEVVKISTTCDGAKAPAGGGPGTGAGSGGPEPGAAAGTGGGDVSALESALAKDGRAEVYDIHFSFNSDRLRDESEPVLRRIAGLMTRHRDWRLSIEGHTDNIASDAFNLDLSRRRAAAVRKALVERFGVEGARLTSEGFGESQPRDTNETLKGRARNRRVELVRRAGR